MHTYNNNVVEFLVVGLLYGKRKREEEICARVERLVLHQWVVG
jgi:hypothetical protein